MERLKNKRHVIAVGIIVNILALINDTTYTWSSPVLVKLLSNDTTANPLGRPITGDEETWIGSLVWVGAILGSFPFGFMADRFGRKPIILLLAVPHVACFLAFAFADDIRWFYAGRTVAGVSVSGIYLVLPMYMAEIAEDSFRGIFLFTYYMAANFGDLLSYILGPYVSIRTFNLILALFPAVFFVLFWLVAPESPTFLAGRDDDEARRALRKLRGRQDVEKDLDTIVAEKNRNRSGKILQTLSRKYGFKALVISTGLQMFLTFTGMTVILTYTEIIFSTTGSKISPDVSSIIVGLILFFSTLVGVFTIEKAGRKILLICSALGMIFAEALLGVYFYLQDHNYTNIESLQWMPLFCLVFFTVSYANGFGPLPFAITTEVCPSNVKFFIGTTVNVLGGIEYFALNKFFNNLNDNLGKGGTFWFFCGCCTLALLFVLFIVPETKGRSFQEIQEIMDKEKFVKLNVCEKRKEAAAIKLSEIR